MLMWFHCSPQISYFKLVPWEIFGLSQLTSIVLVSCDCSRSLQDEAIGTALLVSSDGDLLVRALVFFLK